MRRLAAVVALLVPTSLAADPATDSCRLLAVIGGNLAADVPSLVEEVGGLWSAENRSLAVQQLSGLASGGSFAGGSVWRIASLGDDVEEHLVILRLREGEVSGMRLRYEWTPEGLALVSLEIKRQFSELVAGPVLQPPERVACP
jgi:hypothetical protein